MQTLPTPRRRSGIFADHVVEIKPKTEGRVFARFDPRDNRTVVELIRECDKIENEWHPEFLASCVEITGMSVELGMIRREDGSFAHPGLMDLPPINRMQLALAQGCTIKYKADPKLNATYAATGSAWQQMRDELAHNVSFAEFTDGSKTLTWQALSGEVVFTDFVPFSAIVRAIANWVAAWRNFVDGKQDSPPAPTINI